MMKPNPQSPGDWFDALHNEIGEGASDRAVVITASAMIDLALELVIKRRLVAVSDGRDLFAGPNAPFGTFSARILAAYQLGIITSRFKADLDRIRKIRNDAAHEPFGVQLDTSPMREHVKTLADSSDQSAFEHYPEWSGWSKEKRTFLASWMLYSLHCDVADVKPLEEQKAPEFGYVNYPEIAARYGVMLHEPKDDRKSVDE